MPVKPRISIVITCFNDGEFLPVCISSVDKIKDVPAEVIIVNDGSTDQHTIKFLSELKADGYQVIDQPNQGSSAARNRGISQAAADYVLLIDADDFIEPELVYEALQVLDRQPGTGIVYSDLITFGNETGKRHVPDYNFTRLLIGNFVYISSVFRKAIWTQLGGFDGSPALKAHQDWDFWIMAGKAGWHFHHIKKCYFHYRIRANSTTQMAHEPDVQKEINKYITEKHADVYTKHSLEIIRSLKESMHELSGTVKLLDQSCKAYADKVGNLDDRIVNMENSRWWKLKFQMQKIRNVFSSTEKGGFSNRNFLQRIFFFFTSKGRKVIRELLTKLFKQLYLMLEDGSVTIIAESNTHTNKGGDRYQNWIEKHTAGSSDLMRMKSNIGEFHEKPVISILVTLNHPQLSRFVGMIESVVNQVYPHWELCIADSGGDPEISDRLKLYAADDSRIKIIHPAETANAAVIANACLAVATGSYTMLLGQEDTLEKNALYEIVTVINNNPQANLIYCDEDKIDADNKRSSPVFKPKWSPDNLLSRNYIGSAAVVKMSLVKKLGGFRPEFDGSHFYDLLLRITEETVSIFHIADVLYHERQVEDAATESTASRTHISRLSRKAINESLVRRNEPGTAEMIPGFENQFIVRYEIKESKKVSVIIPTRNKADVLETCLKTLFEKTLYPNFEVVLLDNRSDDPALFHLVKFFESTEPERFRCIHMDMEFNFSKLMNEAVKQTDGDYLLLLNNDMEILTADWMNALVEQVQRKSTGAAGARLLYHNDTIQHAGVIIGIGGVADHAFVGVHKDGPSYMNYVNLVNNYSAVTAACLMVRREVYNEVGGFDEGFAVEFNDVDFCLKLITAGYYNIYLPHVFLYHYESLTRGHPKSSKESFKRHLIEVKRFQDKWMKFVNNDPFFNPNFSLNNNDFQVKIN